MSEITVNEFFFIAGALVTFIVIGIILVYFACNAISIIAFLLRRKMRNSELRKELEYIKEQQQGN